ncbi:TonB-dependent receptor [Xanthomonas sp. AmX2]|uniref:TonB-dependent receptor n=1 Tax=Xanthomonas sp. TaxID=29446 RepID=UPI00197F7BEE|nr:TonB-dependent receptor [Xanthomonas sp.]MBN6152027.1 TonB-dependent receptor [Xanthomonas sp.]
MNNRAKRALQRSTLSIALGLCVSTVAFAQSNTAGAIFGQAASGSTIQVQNAATGFSRSISVGNDGTYRFSAVPNGTYTVTLEGSDGTRVVREGVNVSVGTGTPVNFTAASASSSAATLDTVQVRGNTAVNPIDVSSVESNTILTAEQINKIPVARDTTSVALLAPGTVRGDTAFGNLASFGGSSVAENQYYVNGFNVTNTFRNLNFAKIPFEAIAEQQIKTGGYGAEFGRSTGGVVNQITKRGTNDFHAGGNVFYSPRSLMAETESYYYNNPLDSAQNGKLAQDNSDVDTNQWVTSAWASGALIQDRLFAYGIVSYGKTENGLAGTPFGDLPGDEEIKNDPIWLLKMDWNINDSNKLEFTAFSDTTKTVTATKNPDTGAFIGTKYLENGGENYIGKYTGYFTDTFTLSALYGHGEFSRETHLKTVNGLSVEYGGDLNTPATGCPRVVDVRPGYRRIITGGQIVSNCNITNDSIDRRDSKDTRDQFRVDAEWVLGDHLIRFGYDRDDYESVAGQSIEGGRLWRYSTNNGPDGAAETGDEFDLVREQIVNQGTTAKLKQWAFYVEDSWKITDNFLAYVGARWDTFENLNGEGQTYVKIDKQFGPRLGFSWDANGDSSLKIYGNAGRYALPLTPSVAVRGASASLYTRQNYRFTGVDPVTGAPTGLTPVGGLQYINGEFGEPKTPQTIAATNLDPMYQDEYILGFQSQLTDHQSIGARGIYRKLKAAIDDNCDYTPIYNQAVEDGFDPVLPNSGFPYCRMFNPGEDSVFLTDIEGNGTLTEYTIAADLLSPKAKRTYKALELFWDGSWEKFFFQASWTIAWNKGNTEGGVKSDIGQGDTSVTQDFDYKELMVDSYGYLPNDRRHALKVFGNYQLTDELSIGANLVVQSGRPKNCLGVLYPYHDDIHPYGSSFFRCGTTADGGVNGPSVAVPRGTAGRLPWTNALDLNVAYAPNWAKGWQFKVDVFNVFNNQKVTAVSEVAEDGTTGAPLATYGLWRSTQAPRSARFMVQYDF